MRINVYTVPGESASAVGESYAAATCVQAVDRANGDGTGVVCLDVDPADAADVERELDADDRVESYRRRD